MKDHSILFSRYSKNGLISCRKSSCRLTHSTTYGRVIKESDRGAEHISSAAEDTGHHKKPQERVFRRRGLLPAERPPGHRGEQPCDCHQNTDVELSLFLVYWPVASSPGHYSTKPAGFSTRWQFFLGGIVS